MCTNNFAFGYNLGLAQTTYKPFLCACTDTVALQQGGPPGKFSALPQWGRAEGPHLEIFLALPQWGRAEGPHLGIFLALPQWGRAEGPHLKFFLALPQWGRAEGLHLAGTPLPWCLGLKLSTRCLENVIPCQ